MIPNGLTILPIISFFMFNLSQAKYEINCHRINILFTGRISITNHKLYRDKLHNHRTELSSFQVIERSSRTVINQSKMVVWQKHSIKRKGEKQRSLHMGSLHWSIMRVNFCFTECSRIIKRNL